MAESSTITKIKTCLRISHTALDADISDTIDACLADLETNGIVDPDETDALILAAIKNYCRAEYIADTGKADAFRKAYDAQKAHLQMSTGYGLPEPEAENE